jgi:hypothetical protein
VCCIRRYLQPRLVQVEITGTACSSHFSCPTHVTGAYNGNGVAPAFCLPVVTSTTIFFSSAAVATLRLLLPTQSSSPKGRAPVRHVDRASAPRTADMMITRTDAPRAVPSKQARTSSAGIS